MKIESFPEYEKHDNGLVENTDRQSYTQYMMQKKAIKKTQTMEADINNIKREISTIKELLMQLLKGQ